MYFFLIAILSSAEFGTFVLNSCFGILSSFTFAFAGNWEFPSLHPWQEGAGQSMDDWFWENHSTSRGTSSAAQCALDRREQRGWLPVGAG